MPTQAELVDALYSLEADAPTRDDVLLSVPTPASRRRPVAIAASAAAVVAVAITAGLLAVHRDAGPATGAAATPTADASGIASSQVPTVLRYSFSVKPIVGYTVKLVTVEPGVQTASVTGIAPSGRHVNGVIYVFSKGAFDPSAVRAGSPVAVGKFSGFEAMLPDPGDAPGADGLVASLAWPYAVDSWALVQASPSHTGPALTAAALNAELHKIAVAVDTTKPTPTRLPYRIGYLPAGMYPESLDGTELTLGDGRPESRPAAGLPGAISIAWGTAGPVTCHTSAGFHATSFTINHVPGCLLRDGADGATTADRATTGDGTTTVLLSTGGIGELTLILDASHVNIYPDSQLERILGSITMAPNPANPDTWFDATTALPK